MLHHIPYANNIIGRLRNPPLRITLRYISGSSSLGHFQPMMELLSWGCEPNPCPKLPTAPGLKVKDKVPVHEHR